MARFGGRRRGRRRALARAASAHCRAAGRLSAALRLARPGRTGPRRSARRRSGRPRLPSRRVTLTRRPAAAGPAHRRSGRRGDGESPPPTSTRGHRAVRSLRRRSRPLAHRTRRGPDRQRQLRGLRRRPRPGPAGHRRPGAAAMLAETWIEATSAADGTVRGRVRLITSANQAARAYAGVDRALAHRQPAEHLLQARPAAWSEEYRYTAVARDGELTGGQLSSLRPFDAHPATPSPTCWSTATEPRPTGGAAVARAASGAWRQQDRALASLPRSAAGGRRRAGRPRAWRSAACPRSAPSTRKGWCSRSRSQHAPPRDRTPTTTRSTPGWCSPRTTPAADHQADRAAADPRPRTASPSMPR